MNGIGSREYWPKEWPDWPEDPKARKAVQSSFELGLFFLNQPACYRESRLKHANEKARKYLSEMTEEEQQQGKALVALWERNALIQQGIRYEEEKKGVDAVDHLLTKWRSAEAQMRRAEEGASQFGLAGHEYFRSRVERFRILQEEKDEVGQLHGRPDYSELREQWYSRKPITAPLIWPWDDMLALCKRFEVNKEMARWRRAGLKLAVAGVVLGVAGIAVTVILDIF